MMCVSLGGGFAISRSASTSSAYHAGNVAATGSNNNHANNAIYYAPDLIFSVQYARC